MSDPTAARQTHQRRLVRGRGRGRGGGKGRVRVREAPEGRWDGA